MTDGRATAGPASPAVRVGRLPEKGSYDLDVINAILDVSPLCHLGYLREGRPVVVPTFFGRDGDQVYIHGSAAARSLRSAASGLPVCLTVTHLDGYVYARSLFNHSANYRSVVVLGDAVHVTDPEEHLHGLRVVTDHLQPGRWDDARGPSQKELKATAVLRLSLEQASAKVSEGDPGDEPEDLDLDVWAGVVPVRQVLGAPVPSGDLRPGIAVPSYLRAE